MRLLCVAKDMYPPFRVDVVELFSRRIVGAGWTVDWLMPGGSAADHVVVHSERERFFLIRADFPLRALGRIAGLLWAASCGRYDLVQARDRPLLALPFLLAARLAGSPFVYWMSFPIVESVERRARDPGENLSRAGRLARLAYARLATALFYKLVLRWSDRIVVQSPRMLAEVAARGIEAAKMTPVPMGVSTEAHHPARIEPVDDPRLEGRRVLVYVGTIEPIRRVDVAVGALRHVVDRGIDAVLVLVGDARRSDLDRLMAFARDRGVADRVIAIGQLPLAHALSYVRRADLCLSPCPTDPLLIVGTPTKLVEYLAMGRPVVANPHPDQEFVLNASGAGLLAELDPEAFGEAAVRLLADRKMAETMGARGPGWVAANRSYERLSAQVLALYDDLLRGRPNPDSRRPASGRP